MIKQHNAIHRKKCRKNFINNLTNDKKQQIIDDYVLKGFSLVEMSKKYNLPYSQFQRLLPELGVNLRGVKEACNMEDCRNKYRETMLKKYGTTHNFNKDCALRKQWEQRLMEEEGINNVFQRKEVIDKIKDTMYRRYGEKGIYYNRTKGSTLDYWIDKLGREEGIKRYNEICHNKGKSSRHEYYIEKYGEIEGEVQWKIRLEQLLHSNFTWQNGLNEKCYKILDKNDIKYEKEFKIYKEDTHRYYSYDVKIGNLIIELNGVYWHCSPKLYQPNDIVHFPLNTMIKAKDKWEYDRIKKEKAEQCGYIVEVIWEDEFNETKLLEILNKYKNGNS